MEHLPIIWEDKVNSPELLAFLQQYGEKHYLSAEEINKIRDAINELFDTVTDTPTDLSLKEDKSNKGIANGYAPLNEFVKIASTYLSIVNDLTTGGATSLASAETVKVLKGQIDGINLLLTSDNINLDTVQELVDAIETVQTSLSTILVNDLTTGGITKALTAEMGKTLKGLVDLKQNLLPNPTTGEGTHLDPNAYALQDGTILYYKGLTSRWFTPTGTVSTSGTTVTSIGTQFTATMIGAKITINGESRIITAFTSNTIVTVGVAFSQNYSGIVAGSWGVYNKAIQIFNFTILFYYYNSNTAVSITNDNGINANNFQLPAAGFYSSETVLANNYTFKWSQDSNKFGTKDLGLRRNSAGILEIFDGINANGLEANRRDLYLRKLLASTMQLIALPDSTGDALYTKQLTAKADGTVGWEAKSAGTEFIISGTTIEGVKNEIIIPNGVVTIRYSAFQNNLLTAVTIPNSVTTIEQYAFYNNLLTSVTIPNSVTSIRNSAFQDNQLTAVTISTSVTSIQQYAFTINKLTTVTLPAGCTYYVNSFDTGVTITGGILI